MDSPDVWPFLYLPAAENWLYFIKRVDGVPVFFDYSENKFLMPAPLARKFYSTYFLISGHQVLSTVFI